MGGPPQGDDSTHAPAADGTLEVLENKEALLSEPVNWVFNFENHSLTFKIIEVIGKGTFGTVYRAFNEETPEVVAIKRTVVPEEHETTEARMVSALRHRNIVEFKYAFSTPLPDNDKEVFIITEFVSSDLNKLLEYCHARNSRMSDSYIMVYMYQILKGLEFIHRYSVAHRDLKPSNILVELSNHALKICDFGSAEILRKNQKNVAYVCSRFYRAPELLMGFRYYTTAVDMWSCGCIMAELYLGTALFTGNNRKDQLKKIEAVLGSPSDHDYRDMGQNMLPMHFRTFYPKPWRTIFGESITDPAIDLISQMVKYSPRKRIDAASALRHPFFDPIRRTDFTLSSGVVPPLFDSEEECVISRAGS